MRKKRNIFLAFLTLMTIAFWVGLEIWTVTQTSTVKPDVEKAVTPLDPSLDTTIIDQLSQRKAPQ